jgi:transcriptional regulator with XRE-family HTH domain
MTTPAIQVFAQRLRSARKAAGYTSAACFARALGVEVAAYRYWERGGSAPRLATLIKICELLKIEANELIPPPPKARRRAKSHSAKLFYQSA